MKNIPILASPSKKGCVDLMQKARIACYKSKVRILRSKKKIEIGLPACKSKLENISNETLERTSQEANLMKHSSLS